MPSWPPFGGANGWEDIEVYAESHQDWLATILDLRHGIPHADTYQRVFERIAPKSFQPCLLNWLGQIVEATGAQIVPIDGKTVRGSYDQNQQQSACIWSVLGRVSIASLRLP